MYPRTWKQVQALRHSVGAVLAERVGLAAACAYVHLADAALLDRVKANDGDPAGEDGSRGACKQGLLAATRTEACMRYWPTWAHSLADHVRLHGPAVRPALGRLHRCQPGGVVAGVGVQAAGAHADPVAVRQRVRPRALFGY